MYLYLLALCSYFAWWASEIVAAERQAIENREAASEPSSRQSLVWANTLRNTVTLKPNPSIPQSSLSRILTIRKSTLSILQGYVKIGDLILRPTLESQITSFVNLTQAFDNNVLRLSTAHHSTISNLNALTVTFCHDFRDLLRYAEQVLCQPSNPRIENAHQGESTKKREQHEQLTTQLRETKIHLSVAATSIIHAVRLLFTDTVTELDACYTKPQCAPINLLFSTDEDRTLSFHPLPTTHSLHQPLTTSLQMIYDSQPQIDVALSTMRNSFFDIDDVLADLVAELQDLKLDNFIRKAGKIVGLIAKLHDLLQVDTLV